MKQVQGRVLHRIDCLNRCRLMFSGTVTRTSEVRPELFMGCFRCLECGTIIRNVEQQFKFTEPSMCPVETCQNKCVRLFTLFSPFCRLHLQRKAMLDPSRHLQVLDDCRKAWSLIKEESTFIDWQRAKVQENTDEVIDSSLRYVCDACLERPTCFGSYALATSYLGHGSSVIRCEQVPAGSLPRTIEVIFRNDTVEQARAGDKLVFAGSMVVVPDVAAITAPGQRSLVKGAGTLSHSQLRQVKRQVLSSIQQLEGPASRQSHLVIHICKSSLSQML